MTWSLCVFLLTTLCPIEARGYFRMATRRIAEVPICVHKISLCTLCFGRSHSYRCRTPLQLNRPCSAASTPREGPGADETPDAVRTNRRAAGKDSLAPRAGAEASESGREVEPPSPEARGEGIKNKPSRPVPKLYDSTVSILPPLPDPRGLNQEGTKPPLPPTSRPHPTPLPLKS